MACQTEDGAVAVTPSRFLSDLRDMARRDRVLHAIALISLLAGFAVQPVSGRHPDWPLFVKVLGKVWLIFGALALAAVVWQLFRLALIERSSRPTREILLWVRQIARQEGRGANALHTIAIFVVFASGFAVLKGAIGLVAPFSWDATFAELDRALHFGRYPHEWLQPLLDRPRMVSWVNIAYHVWFFVQIATISFAAFATRRQFLRHQYLMSYMLVWLIGGFLTAVAFASAGPVYFERLGFGSDYEPLMETLRAAGTQFPVWALDVQERLWAGFTGELRGSAGISAFPSMHVATATLFALAARHIHRWLFAASVVFWVLTMIGSVLLGWHYAVDGYAGALIAVVIWRFAGFYGHRRARAEPEMARAAA